MFIVSELSSFVRFCPRNCLMIMIVWWQARAEDGRVARGDHFPVEAAELYWHFVDGIWVILFVILYLV